MDRRPIIVVGSIFSKFIIPQNLKSYYLPLLEALDENLSFDVPGREHTIAYNEILPNGDRKWDGKKHLFNITDKPLKKIAWKRYVTEPYVFLSGNLIRFIQICHCFEVDPHLESDSDFVLSDIDKMNIEWNDDFTIREYQQKAIDAAITYKRGLLQIATGGGKTIIASKIIQTLGIKPVIFLVTTKDLLHQAHDVFSKTLKRDDIGIIGDGKCDIQDITVSTIQTAIQAADDNQENFRSLIRDIADMQEGSQDETEIDQPTKEKIRQFLKSVRVIFFDECQHAPADTCRAVLYQCENAVYKYGLSATPNREDGEDLTIEGLFGNNLINISASYLIKKGHLVRPEIYMFEIETKVKSTSYQKEYKEYIVENAERNAIICGIAQAYSQMNKTVLILVNQIKHGNIIEEEIDDCIFLNGKKASKFRKQSIQDIRDRKTKVMIATTLADEGLDLPSLDVLILAGSGKSRTKALQRIGRVLRPSAGKEKAVVIDFLDAGGKYSKKHAAGRISIYRSEEEFIIKKMDWKKLVIEFGLDDEENPLEITLEGCKLNEDHIF